VSDLVSVLQVTLSHTAAVKPFNWNQVEATSGEKISNRDIDGSKVVTSVASVILNTMPLLFLR